MVKVLVEVAKGKNFDVFVLQREDRNDLIRLVQDYVNEAEPQHMTLLHICPIDHIRDGELFDASQTRCTCRLSVSAEA